MFCSDIDLLRWEPNIALEASFATQTLLTGTGSVSGTTLTLAAGSFTDGHVRPGLIACLSGTLQGCFPILSVDTPTTCTLSVIYEGLDDTPTIPASPGSAAGLQVAIRSFYPQRRIISDLLLRMAGVEQSKSEVILNLEDFRRAGVLGTLHLIYSAMATAAVEHSSDLTVRAELYERLYRKSLRSLVAEIDTNHDGEPDRRQALRIVQFTRL